MGVGLGLGLGDGLRVGRGLGDGLGVLAGPRVVGLLNEMEVRS